MTNPKPNVVPGEAALVARSFVFENRDALGIDPAVIVERLLAAGHGSDIPAEVRRKRLKTWALQVLRRLRKRGWLEAPGENGWPPTAALRACARSHALGKPAPKRTAPASKVFTPPPARHTPAPQEFASAPVRHAPPAREIAPTPIRHAPKPPESWSTFIEDWVFNHRERGFGVAEVAVAIVQGGFGSGDIGDRLDDARELVELELGSLEHAGLLAFDEQTELWQPTDLLQSWPETDEA